jgi:hypothetical protein
MTTPNVEIRPGICSITLRAEPIAEVVRIAAQAGLEGIEWGGDVHVPPSDAAAADLARGLTVDAGLAVASYGSYYRAGDDVDDAAAVVQAAARLGAPRIRIWAGRVGSAEATSDERAAVVAGARAIARRAADAGIDVGFEFHRRTLTDTVESTLRLLDEVDQQVTSYWQPPVGKSDDEALDGLGRVLPWLSTVHVFSWSDTGERLTLAEREGLWRRAFAAVASTGRKHDALLEFVPGDDPAAVAVEAAALREFLEGPAR